MSNEISLSDKLLFPSENSELRNCFLKAKEYSAFEGICDAHVISTAYVIQGLAMALCHVPFYLSQALSKFAIYCVQLECEKGFSSLKEESLHTLQCMLLAASATCTIGLGLFFPNMVYTQIAPDYVLSPDTLAEIENLRSTQNRLQELERELRSRPRASDLEVRNRELEDTRSAMYREEARRKELEHEQQRLHGEIERLQNAIEEEKKKPILDEISTLAKLKTHAESAEAYLDQKLEDLCAQSSKNLDNLKKFLDELKSSQEELSPIEAANHFSLDEKSSYLHTKISLMVKPFMSTLPQPEFIWVCTGGDNESYTQWDFTTLYKWILEESKLATQQQHLDEKALKFLGSNSSEVPSSQHRISSDLSMEQLHEEAKALNLNLKCTMEREELKLKAIELLQNHKNLAPLMMEIRTKTMDLKRKIQRTSLRQRPIPKRNSQHFYTNCAVLEVKPTFGDGQRIARMKSNQDEMAQEFDFESLDSCEEFTMLIKEEFGFEKFHDMAVNRKRRDERKAQKLLQHRSRSLSSSSLERYRHLFHLFDQAH